MTRRSIGRRLSGLALVANLVACAGTGSPAVPTAAVPTSPRTTTPAATASPTATAAPTPAPELIVAPPMPLAEPLEVLAVYDGDGASAFWAPVLDAQGRIWVASIQDDQFLVLDRDLQLVERWGEYGDGDGQLSFHGELGSAFGSIAFLPDGGYVVGDTINRRVQWFDGDRAYVSQLGAFGTDPGEFLTISGLAVGRDGHLFVADNDRLDVQEFDADGTWVRTVCSDTIGPLIVTDTDGALYCLDGNRLDKIGPDGTPIYSVDLKAHITLGIGITIGPDGHVYVASVDVHRPVAEMPERLVELDPDGTVLTVWPTGGEGIAIDAAGDRLFVASVDLGTVTAYALPID